jgi:hypothetical protein
MTNAKKILFALGLMLLMVPAFAQVKPSSAKATPPKDCFREWLDLFRERGGKPVTDGTQEVIITIRRQDKSICWMGKVDVVGGKMKLPIWVQKDDGTFETLSATMGRKLDPEFASNISEEDMLTITDGTSISFRSSEQEYGRLFFYKFLNDKPKTNKTAPSPSDLIKK